MGEEGLAQAVEQLGQQAVHPAQHGVELRTALGFRVHGGQPAGVGEPERGGGLQYQSLVVAEAPAR